MRERAMSIVFGALREGLEEGTRTTFLKNGSGGAETTQHAREQFHHV